MRSAPTATSLSYRLAARIEKEVEEERKQNRKCQIIILSWYPDGTPRRTDRLIVGGNVTLTLTSSVFRDTQTWVVSLQRWAREVSGSAGGPGPWRVKTQQCSSSVTPLVEWWRSLPAEKSCSCSCEGERALQNYSLGSAASWEVRPHQN
jgi:hypothetical protein